MFKVVICLLSVLFGSTAYSQSARQQTNRKAAALSAVPSMPTEAEIGELISKASEYVDTYRRTFTNTKASLDKAPTPGFYEKAIEECTQASEVISAIKKNGSTAVALVSLIAILDDMSLNGARASASTMLVAMSEDRAKSSDHAMQDFQDIAQAEKNCYDISELLLHATIRYISAEENALRTLLHNQKQ
jgi:predicted  nucleic acid-binding Zn-ribbon protein